MPTITESINASLLAFFDAVVPDDIKASGKSTAKELHEEAKKKRKAQEKVAKAALATYNNSHAVSLYYKTLIRDAKSLSESRIDILTNLKTSTALLGTELAKLQEPAFKDLPTKLIASTKKASELRHDLGLSVKILQSLDGDINSTPASSDSKGKQEKGDYAFKELKEALKELDDKEKAADDGKTKKGPSYVEQLDNLRAASLAAQIEAVITSFDTLYEKTKSQSINYQDKLTPEFARITKLHTDLDEAVKALEKDLTDNQTALEEAETADKAALTAANDALEITKNLMERLTEIKDHKPAIITAVKKPGEGDDGGNGGEEAAEKVDPDIVARKIATEKAKELTEEHLKELAEYNKLLLAAKSYMEKHNKTLKEHIDKLDKTNTNAFKVNTIIHDLVSALISVNIFFTDGGASSGTMLDSFMKDLQKVAAVEEKITALNAGVSQVESEGDIKTYLAKLATELGKVPEMGKEVINNILSTNAAMYNLRMWLIALEEDVAQKMISGINTSSMDLDTIKHPHNPKKGSKPTDKIVLSIELLEKLGNQDKKDAEVIASEGLNTKAWKTSITKWNDAILAHTSTAAVASPEVKTLAEWETVLDTTKAALETEVALLENDLAFFQQFFPAAA